MVALRKDTLLAINGNIVQDGNYLRTTTVVARVIRHLLAWWGEWPGGEGRLFGNKVWARLQQANDNAETRAEAMALFEEALDPLVAEGAIHSVSVTTEMWDVGRVFKVAWKSRQGEPGDVVLTSPWLLNP